MNEEPNTKEINKHLEEFSLAFETLLKSFIADIPSPVLTGYIFSVIYQRALSVDNPLLGLKVLSIAQMNAVDSLLAHDEDDCEYCKSKRVEENE